MGGEKLSLAQMAFIIAGPRIAGSKREMAFYEKVIKVKADVAAYLISCFPSASPSGGDVVQ